MTRCSIACRVFGTGGGFVFFLLPLFVRENVDAESALFLAAGPKKRRLLLPARLLLRSDRSPFPYGLDLREELFLFIIYLR